MLLSMIELFFLVFFSKREAALALRGYVFGVMQIRKREIRSRIWEFPWNRFKVGRVGREEREKLQIVVPSYVTSDWKDIFESSESIFMTTLTLIVFNLVNLEKFPTLLIIL